MKKKNMRVILLRFLIGRVEIGLSVEILSMYMVGQFPKARKQGN